MAKKTKKKLSPKDDLIESLMNDVQEISGEATKHRPDALPNLYDEDSGVSSNKDFMIGFGGDDNSAEEHSSEENHSSDEPQNTEAAELWQQMNSPSSADDENIEEYKEKSFGISIEPPGVEGLEASTDDDGDSNVNDDKTMNIQEAHQHPSFNPESLQNSSSKTAPKTGKDQDAEKTIAVAGFANRQPRPQAEVSPKISFGSLREQKAHGGGSVYASSDATLAQAESLRIAQQRILDLEKEVEKYRLENEELASAGEIIRDRAEELTSRIFSLEKEKHEVTESLSNELILLKGSLQYKESEVGKARLKIEELEARLKSDFKKIRVRERELENRLELVKAEKTALLRAKDENILELKRKIDHLQSELDNYRDKVLELNKTIDLNQEQFKRTVRALRLALSNLEVKEENIVPLKKAE